MENKDKLVARRILFRYRDAVKQIEDGIDSSDDEATAKGFRVLAENQYTLKCCLNNLYHDHTKEVYVDGVGWTRVPKG